MIKLGLLRVEDNLPFFAAEQDKLYEKYGLQVELVTFNSARERDIALEAGEIDGGLADLLATALFKKGGTHVKVVALGLGAAPEEGRFAILSAPQSGITSPRQLRGVPVAVSYNTIIHYLAEEMLAAAGLKQNEISLQNIPDLSIRLDSLLAGKEVRAALLPDPLAALAEKSGACAVIDDTRLGLNLSQTVIIFREDTLNTKPSAVKGVLSTYQEAGANLNSHPQKYRELVLDKARIPKPLEDSYAIPHYSPLQLPTSEMVERVMKWMAGKGLLAKPYAFEELVEPAFIPRSGAKS
jgi:NitT/TauT family transport system substrate-binding protein